MTWSASSASGTAAPPNAAAQSGAASSASRWDGQELLWLGGLLLAALALRLWGLASESIWLDEATSIVLARMSLPDMVRWTAVDIHPPLYYAILHFWLALGDGEAQVRLLSVVCGVCSVAFLYLLARRLFNRRVALASAALLAASPFHVWYSQETRMYAMLALLALVTSYCMIAALLDGKRWAWIAYVVFAIASLYTHYYAFFILLFQNVAALYFVWRGCITRPVYRCWLAAQVIAALAFVPWLPVLISQVRGGGGSWVARSGAPGPGALASTAAMFTLGPDVHWYPALLRRAAYGVFGLLCCAGILSPLRRRASAGGVVFALAYLCVPLGAAWLISQVKPLYSARYLLPFAPAYYILIAQGLDALAMLAGDNKARQAGLWGVVLTALVAVGLIGCAGSATHQQLAEWRDIAARLTTSSGPGDVVVFVPGWNAKPFDYYARGRVALVSDTPIPIVPADVQALADNAARGRARLWLVQAQGHYADPQNMLSTYLDQTYTLIDRRQYRDNMVVSLYTLRQ